MDVVNLKSGCNENLLWYGMIFFIPKKVSDNFGGAMVIDGQLKEDSMCDVTIEELPTFGFCICRRNGTSPSICKFYR